MQPQTGDDVVDALLAAAHAVRTSTDTGLRALGMSLSRMKALKALQSDDGPPSMRQVSDAVHLAARTVTDLVEDLENDGLLVRQPSPTDRRVTLLHITDAGRAAYATARAEADAIAAGFTAGLSDGERSTLVTLLSGLTRVPASG